MAVNLIKQKLINWVNESPSTRDPRFFLYQIKRKGFLDFLRIFLTKNFYDDSFYGEHEKMKITYSILSKLIISELHISSAIDFGCGNGFILGELYKLGVSNIKGIEGNFRALDNINPAIRDKIIIKDLSESIVEKLYDLVICTEVLEHIPKSKSEIVLTSLCRASRKYILFSAAHPGQWGDGHINCQSKDFWISLFAKRNFYVSKKTQNLKTELVKSDTIKRFTPWMIQNIILLEKRNI